MRYKRINPRGRLPVRECEEDKQLVEERVKSLEREGRQESCNAQKSKEEPFSER